MLQIKNLNLKINNITILQNINFDIHENEIVSIIGPSGCGKSSILKSIAGILKDHTGTIILDNQNITQYPINKRNITLVFQEYSLFPHMTIFENMLVATNDADKIKYILSDLELYHLKDKYVFEMSGGEQQRCAIARAIIYSPKVLLLDEPFSNVDKITTLKIRTKILHLLKYYNITTIMVSHDLEDVCVMSDRCLVMDKAIIVQDDILINLYNKPTNLFVAELFGNIIHINNNYYRPESIKISIEWKLGFKSYKVYAIKFNKSYNEISIYFNNEIITIFDYLRLDIIPENKIYLMFGSPLNL